MQHHHLTAREWDELAADAEFRTLLRARRRFTLPAVIFALAFFFALPIGIALSPAYMSQTIFGPLTRAWSFAFLQFVMAWGLLAIYMREARKFDEVARRVATHAREEFAE